MRRGSLRASVRAVSAFVALLCVGVLLVVPVEGHAASKKSAMFVVTVCETEHVCEFGFSVDCEVAVRAADHPGLTCRIDKLVRPSDICSVGTLLHYDDARERLEEKVIIPGLYLVSSEGYTQQRRSSTDYTLSATLIETEFVGPHTLEDFHAHVARQSFYKVTVPTTFTAVRVFLYPNMWWLVGLGFVLIALFHRRREPYAVAVVSILVLVLVALWFFSRYADACRLGLDTCVSSVSVEHVEELP